MGYFQPILQNTVQDTFLHWGGNNAHSIPVHLHQKIRQLP
ncbi:hypothetical protein LRLP16767_LR202_01138 [Limosilactobacillus reuteri]|uniref:Uncharacterized protein n=1 Tax=Limosilactobacillus reuteri TaxID=1598 RepID=A0A0U5JV47_LIMRT|nr:hypothetical protein LRLP16767_LR202_01138 [Limosilactobacillus reuteri]